MRARRGQGSSSKPSLSLGVQNCCFLLDANAVRAYPAGEPCGTQVCETPTSNHAALPTAMAAAPMQLRYLHSASCMALAHDLLSHTILANLLTARCSFHKAAVKTKKTKSYVYFVSIE